MPIWYRESDADPDELDGQEVGVVGYRHLGTSADLELRDSGVRVSLIDATVAGGAPLSSAKAAAARDGGAPPS